MNTLIVEDDRDWFFSMKNWLKRDLNFEVFPVNYDEFRPKLTSFANQYNKLTDKQEIYNLNELTCLLEELDHIITTNGINFILIDLNLTTYNEESGNIIFNVLTEKYPTINVYKHSAHHGENTITKATDDGDQIQFIIDTLNLPQIQNRAAISTIVPVTPVTPVTPVAPVIPIIPINANNLLFKNIIVVVLLSVFVLNFYFSYKIYTNRGNVIYNFGLFLTISTFILNGIFLFWFFLILKGVSFVSFNIFTSKFKSRIDTIITFLFYFLIMGSVIISLILLIQNIHENLNLYEFEPLKFIESLFLTFLPVIIVSSFYFFYKKSIRQVLVTNADYDPVQGSILMNISKKFFLSSIIAYLIIKIIEKITSLNLNTTYFSVIENSDIKINSNLTELTLYFILIIALIFYYSFLEKHSKIHQSKID